MKLRDLEIWPPVALAPMVGLSHTCLRSLVLGLGGVGLLYTEMLAARRLPHDNPVISPLLARSEEEQPLIYQLVTGDIEHIEPAIEKLHQLGVDGIDLNLGCPAPVQKRQGAGSTLALDRDKLQPMLQLLRKNTELPISVKIRLGVELDQQKLVETCQFYEAMGVDLITIHARLAGEKFCRKPRWSAIAGVVDAIQIPVFANGGIFSVDDARRCLQESGADGLMIGRGGVERPWLLAEIGEQIFDVAKKNGSLTKRDVYLHYISLLEGRISAEKRLGRLKLFTNYFAASFKFGHSFASSIQSSQQMEQATRRAERFFSTCSSEELKIYKGV